MNVNNMSAKDYLDLYCWVQLKNKQIYEGYKTFKPTIQDIEEYNRKVEQFEKAWDNDKSIIHKPIILTEQPKEVNKDNDFDYCLDIGHKFEIFVEAECKKYGVDIGMYYDERQFKGENEIGLEIKHDSKIAETGNVYIEYEAISKKGDKHLPSGILKEDNSKYWLIGTEEEYYIFYKEDLVNIYNQLMSGKKLKGIKFAERSTSKGIIISRDKCKEIMISNSIPIFLVKVGLMY